MLEDFLLFAGGAICEQGALHPFLGALHGCFTEASHLCWACQEVAFCEEHGETRPCKTMRIRSTPSQIFETGAPLSRRARSSGAQSWPFRRSSNKAGPSCAPKC